MTIEELNARIEELTRERDAANAKHETLSALVEGYRRERDEARAEANRLCAALNEVDSDYLMSETQMVAALKDAYRRGAEAMREACAKWVADYCSDGRAGIVRALPIPEDKP